MLTVVICIGVSIICFYLPIMIQDSGLVIDRFKTGFFPPNDVPFEDLSTAATSLSNNGSTKLDGGNKVGATAASRSKKRAGLLGIFGAPKVILQCLSFIPFNLAEISVAVLICT